MPETDELKAKILSELVVNHADALERMYPLAKQFIRITKEGKIDVMVKDKLIGQEKISLDLIGKHYAKRADLSDTEYVKNDELSSELGIKMNSLLPWLKYLRDENIIVQDKKGGREVCHAISLSAIERTLKDIDDKLKNQEMPNVAKEAGEQNG